MFEFFIELHFLVVSNDLILIFLEYDILWWFFVFSDASYCTS